MAVAIVTTYHGPTNYRGSRITATVPARIGECRRYWPPDSGPRGPLDHPAYWRLTIPYPYELNSEDGHRAAAEALAARLNWTGHLYAGALDSGYAFVFGPTPPVAED
jgi:hypothetical protein